MPKHKPYRRLKRRPRTIRFWLPIYAIAGVFILAAAGFITVGQMENRDSFCASCHTQPESTYFPRSTATSAVDLASDHSLKKASHCIDCHSGSGAGGRISAELEGAMNAVKFVTHTMVQPATLNNPIADDNCLKCHASVPQESNFNTHFHRYLAQWQAASPSAATCVTCHTAHTTDGDAALVFVSQTRVEQICQECHSVLRAGGG
ncbi:MAG: cytochrome c3 family protein [Anaerolineaceae bacterium]|nr:cytochrome c3 family protein [Anaerolineaceae bacterium]